MENIKKEVEEKSNNKSGNNIKEGEQQHVIVVGAGVVGVSTAYFLARDYNYKFAFIFFSLTTPHHKKKYLIFNLYYDYIKRVTVIEKESQSAAATSWGNAGVVSSFYYFESSFYLKKFKLLF